MRNATDQESKSKTFDIQTTRCINSYSLYYFPAISYDLEVVQCSHKEDPLNFFFDFGVKMANEGCVHARI